MSESTRPCHRCGESRHWTGSRWRCSRCFNEWQAGRRAGLPTERRAAERAAANANRAVRRAGWSPEKRAFELARTQAWRDADPERYRAGARDWYKRNSEFARAQKLAEYRRNPESFYAQNWVRKARLAGAVCEHGPRCVSAAFLRSMQGGVCLYCEGQAEAADHFNPIARGGLHCVRNIVPACQACNSSKSASEPVAWLVSVGVLIRCEEVTPGGAVR